MTILEILILILIIVDILKSILFHKMFGKRMSNVEVIVANYFTNKNGQKNPVGFGQ